MFIKVFYLHVLLAFVLIIFHQIGAVSRPKRADIDLQTCIANFDVHRDKIIRTQDSQNMGAKYLTEIDLGTREECLRLCCETNNCDVFVFEDKNSGGCYLFHCGPPEDFKCKFTHHANYSSAVLAINRHLPDLENEMKLTKHEQDLNKLRKSESEPEVIPAPAETPPSTTSTTTLPTAEIKTKSSSSSLEQVRKCSRFQFECRSTSECIAIYNACDGIPQCADGSDEAPELDCPGSLTTQQVHITNPKPPQRYDTNLPLRPLAPVVSQSDMYHSQLPEEPFVPPQMPVVPHSDMDFLRPLANPQNNARASYDQYGPPAAQNWALPPPQYPDKNSHIFNHKGNGLQVPDGQEIRYNKYKGALQYLHRALGYSGQYGDGGRYDPKINYYNYRPIQWPNNDAYQQENPKDWHPSPPKNPPPIIKTEEINKTKKLNATKIKVEKPQTDVVAYKMDVNPDLLDGIPEAASGAILSLTLGLILTCILAILIGCRLRVKRRLRKGGKTYAHDADYLVNGMYL